MGGVEMGVSETKGVETKGVALRKQVGIDGARGMVEVGP